jgi:hypothetical protein
MGTDFYIEIPAEQMLVQEPWELEMAGHVLGKIKKEVDWEFDIYNLEDEEEECFIFAGTEAPEEIPAIIQAIADGLPLGPLLEHILKKKTQGT